MDVQTISGLSLFMDPLGALDAEMLGDLEPSFLKVSESL